MIEMTRIVANEKCLAKGILNQLTSSSAIVAFDMAVLSNYNGMSTRPGLRTSDETLTTLQDSFLLWQSRAGV